MSIVIFDIDGTLADHSRRLHHICNPMKNWDAYYADCENDPVITQLAELLANIRGYHTEFGNDLTVLFITGRSEKYREATTNWLGNNLGAAPYIGTQEITHLIMRPDGDHRKAHELKWDLFCKAGYQPKDVLFAVDDSSRIASMWREHGIVCLQVNDGEY